MRSARKATRLLLFLLVLLVPGARALAQFPESELSFQSYGDLLGPFVGGTVEDRRSERMQQPPTLHCLGLAGDVEERYPGFEPAVEVTLGPPGTSAVTAFRAGEYVRSVGLLRQAVRDGDAGSQYVIGCIMEGLARASFRRHSESEAPPHPQRLAVERAIQESRSISGEVRNAVQWLSASAESGFVPAQWELARRWRNWDVLYPRTVAIDWMRRLAAAGDRRARALLGFLYLQGGEVPEDRTEAARLIRQSADAGDPLAMLMLSNLLREGRGVQRDDGQAFLWLERATGAESSDAGYFLSLALIRGEGAPRDEPRAARLLEAAAGRGNSEAAYDLSLLYRQGRGVSADQLVAEQWLDRAIALNSCRARVDRAERQVSSGAIGAEDDGAADSLVNELSLCRGYVLPGRSEPGARPTDLVERARLRARIENLERSLGRGPLDTDQLRSMLLSNNSTRVAEALGLLTRLATIGVDHGRSGGRPRSDAEEALAILAFPARSIPEEVRAQIDSSRWRAQIERLEIGVRYAIVNSALASPLAQPDFPLFFSMLDDGDGGHGGGEILQRIGLSGATFIALLNRLDRGEDQATIQREIAILTWNCGSIRHLYPRLVARMATAPQNCSNVDGLAQLSVRQLERIADLGFGIASMYLAERLFEGRGVERDTPRAIAILDAIPADISRATIGVIFEEGHGIAPDLARAVTLFEQAAGAPYAGGNRWRQEGGATIEARLGVLTLEGLGTAANPDRAARLLRNAATAGVLMAEIAYGDVLYLGAGAQQDEAEALRWYRRAASDGDASAFVRFGFLAASGRWRERGIDGEQWYALAAQADTAAVYRDLARAEAFAPQPRRERVEQWLRRAATKQDAWAAIWLNACSGRPVSCFRRQPAFARLFFARATSVSAERSHPGSARNTGFNAQDRLAADVRTLGEEAEAAREHGEGTQVALDLLDERERLETYHGDERAALETRLRQVLLQDMLLETRYGGLGNYFALVDSSCNWGRASEMAQRLGRPESALLLAKVAVNRLQEARAYLEGLDAEIRECFLDAHGDRYRWLADLLIRADRIAEAETVLGMLKDYEHANYAGDGSRRRSSTRQLQYSAQEQAIVDRIDRVRAREAAPERDNAATRGTAGEATSDPNEEQYYQEFDLILRDVAAMDFRSIRPRSGVTDERSAVGQPSIMADLSRDLPRGTVALHAVVLDERMHWIITTARGRRIVSIDGPASSIDAAVRDLMEAIETRSPIVQRRAKALFDRVFAPVDRELRRNGARHAMMSLDGVLRYVPFAALHDGSEWLLERYTFSHFRRRDDYLGRPARPHPNIAAFGASAQIEGHEPLPGVARELGGIVRTDAADVAGIIPGVERLDAAFTRDALAADLATDFRLIHIASHFVLDEADVDSSYLLLGDGSRLAMRDFRIDGRYTFANADLVTLSACQTAVSGRYGSGLEIDSLATIVQDAGAPTVLASLWSVADRSTADLMLNFYSNRARDGVTTAAALRRAQLDVIDGRHPPGTVDEGEDRGPHVQRDHPYYWAPFILIGDWQ